MILTISEYTSTVSLKSHQPPDNPQTPSQMQDPDERFHWFLYVVIVSQFVIIAILLGAYSNDYLANQYQQAWVQQNAPLLQLLINGNLDVLLIGAGAGLTFLLIQHRRDAGHTIRSSQPPNTQTTKQISNGPITKTMLTDLDEEPPLPPPKKVRTPVELPEHVLNELEKTA
jgi:hypothetical protein